MSIYANALFSLASTQDTMRLWLQDLEMLDTLLMNKPELMNYFSSPLYRYDQKEKALQKPLGSVLNPLLFNFLSILLKKKRFKDLPEIIKLYKAKVLDTLGVVEGTLVTAVPIDEISKKKLQDKWGLVFKKEIVLKDSIDPTLIGGGILTIDDKRIDFSLTGKLQKLKNELKRAAQCV